MMEAGINVVFPEGQGSGSNLALELAHGGALGYASAWNEQTGLTPSSRSSLSFTFCLSVCLCSFF